MIDTYKKYYTKLGYRVLFIGRGDDYVNGRIQGCEEYAYQWKTDSKKVHKRHVNGKGFEDFEDEDYDLVENVETFETKIEIKQPAEKPKIKSKKSILNSY